VWKDLDCMDAIKMHEGDAIKIDTDDVKEQRGGQSDKRGMKVDQEPLFVIKDGGFVFDDEDGGEEQDESVLYDCLLSALLAGLYEIPIERILRCQTGFGRRIKYKSYRRIEPLWMKMQPCVRNQVDKPAISSFQWASIEKIIHSSRGEGGVGEGQMASDLSSFRVFRFDLADSIMDSWGSQFADECIKLASRNKDAGIEVSNAGGYHSEVKSIVDTLSSVSGGHDVALTIAQAVDAAEAFDAEFSYLEGEGEGEGEGEAEGEGERSDKTCKSSTVRQLLGSECWVNVSVHSCFNRLHTHEKSAWSGVLYLTGGDSDDSDSDDPFASKFFSGNFLLKPTSHPSENSYKLNEVEMKRLNIKKMSADLESEHDNFEGKRRIEHCDYVRFSAKKGRIILFPSWCHHAVMPVAIKKEYRHTRQGLRISVAFNLNEDTNPPRKKNSTSNQ